MDQIPEIFDWVTARAKCSIDRMFALLVETVDSDVKAIKAAGSDGGGFELNRVSQSKVVVIRNDATGQTIEGVVLEKTRNDIQIRKSEIHAKPYIVAKVTLGPDGRCRFEVEGETLEPWQVSRRALEDFFFQAFE